MTWRLTGHTRDRRPPQDARFCCPRQGCCCTSTAWARGVPRGEGPDTEQSGRCSLHLNILAAPIQTEADLVCFVGSSGCFSKS